MKQIFMISILYFFAILIDLKSGDFPTWNFAVPAESTINLEDLDSSIPCANGDRQILPRQTIRILIYEIVSLFSMSDIYPLNLLSVSARLFTVLHACKTVA